MFRLSAGEASQIDILTLWQRVAELIGSAPIAAEDVKVYRFECGCEVRTITTPGTDAYAHWWQCSGHKGIHPKELASEIAWRKRRG